MLTPDRRRWMAGAITRHEAEHAHLSSDPAVRAAAIVEVLTSDDPQTRDAIRLVVTAQSTRKRISPKLMNQLATAPARSSTTRVRRRTERSAAISGTTAAAARHSRSPPDGSPRASVKRPTMTPTSAASGRCRSIAPSAARTRSTCPPISRSCRAVAQHRASTSMTTPGAPPARCTLVTRSPCPSVSYTVVYGHTCDRFSGDTAARVRPRRMSGSEGRSGYEERGQLPRACQGKSCG